MFNLYVSGGELDINSGQSVDLNWTPLRFQDDLTDQYTTDFELPRNMKNTRILQASGLLDSSNRFSTRLEPATLAINSEIYNVYVQIVSVDNDKISVCVFEKTIPTDVLNKKLLEFVKDDNSTIYPWKENSWQLYPDVYKKYMFSTYGFDFTCGHYHQSRSINYILDGISFASHYDLPLTDDQLWATATEKNVCPQNKHQVLEVNFTDGEWGLIRGGQHIVNDVQWSWTGGETSITFNRRCNVKMKTWVSWSQSVLDTQDKFLLVTLDSAAPQTPTQADIIMFDTTSHYNEIEYKEYTVAHNYIGTDTTLTFRVQGASSFRFISCVVDLEISDYDIMEDDYGIDMEYIYRNPKMRYRNYSSGDELYMEFNGSSYQYTPYMNQTFVQYCPDLSFCHLGYWCNLPSITLKELIFGLEWLTKKRFVKDKFLYYWVDIDTKYVIDGEITEFEMTNDKLGQKNHLLFAGEEENDDNTVTSINNVWLEADANLHESPFAYSSKRYGNWATYEQYSEKKIDEESGEHSSKFDSIDGLAVSKIVPTTRNLLLRVTLPDMDFDEVTEATTVKIETFDNIKNADWVYLHGRKFMVQEIETDINTGLSEITAIEIWKQNPASTIVWPPKVTIDNIFNITDDSASITFTITEE